MTQSSQLRHRRRADKKTSQVGPWRDPLEQDSANTDSLQALEAARRRKNSDDKNLILGKYKTLEEVPREVTLSHDSDLTQSCH